MARKEREILAAVIPVYKEFAARGQIEISTTPFYHPILPLICDSDIATVSHPGVALPGRFQYPQDALHQLMTAREFIERTFGKAPVGLWPSEGSVSDEALSLAAEAGFEWAASDNGVLARTINQDGGPEVTYRSYLWQQKGREMRMIFRDHFLSDQVGFVYSRIGAEEAAAHFLDRIRENTRDALRTRRGCAGSDHSGWRERLGVLRSQRPAISARVVPADFRVVRPGGADGQRSFAA